MLLLPIGTDVRPRRPPYANWALIALNVTIFLLTDLMGGERGQQLKSLYLLDASCPLPFQYITYQFLHGDGMHLFGNMLFLWIFGNAVCDRMGSLGYALFYLAGGVFAGIVFTHFGSNPILGASGAIAAVTTAFLVLYPRVHVTMLVWIVVFITTFQIPAMILIVFKIILWDNVLAPRIGNEVLSNVAYSAHLGGYAFGFVLPLLLLAARALPRNQFDLLSLWARWGRRQGLPLGVGLHGAGLARPIEVEELGSRPLAEVPLTEAERRRAEILESLAGRDVGRAAEQYVAALARDPHLVLPRQAQLEIANYLAQRERYGDAIRAYEGLVGAYPAAPDIHQIRLWLGLLCGRYLGDYAKAAYYLNAALDGLTQPAQRALASEELAAAEARLRGQ